VVRFTHPVLSLWAIPAVVGNAITLLSGSELITLRAPVEVR